MKFLQKMIKLLFGTKDETEFNLTSYLMGGHISKTTGKRYRKK